MLEDMYKVINRINEIQKRFMPNKNNSLTSTITDHNKNFNETLNEQIAKDKAENIKADKAEIPLSKIKEVAKDYAVKKGLPPALVDAVIQVESAFDPYAVSKKGAAGLMQLMPDTLEDMGVSDPFNIEDNIQAGTDILKNLMDKYGWDFKRALAAYNAGEGAVDKNNGIPGIKETKEYVKKVIDAYVQNIK